jgi:hypothetical protein
MAGALCHSVCLIQSRVPRPSPGLRASQKTGAHLSGLQRQHS